MSEVLLQPSFILHRRPYRETSFLVDIFTQDHGRLTVVAKGVRKPRSASPGLLQAFIPVLLSWTGKGELMTMTHVELRGQSLPLQGESLFAGFYLNELLVALLQKWDPHPDLFAVYEKTLRDLHTGLNEKILRSFEKYLLEDLGYGLLPKSSSTLDSIAADKNYRFIADLGFMPAEEAAIAGNVFSGKSLLAIANEDWQDSTILQEAKRLMRLILLPLLGNKTIYSRRLFS